MRVAVHVTSPGEGLIVICGGKGWSWCFRSLDVSLVFLAAISRQSVVPPIFAENAFPKDTDS